MKQIGIITAMHEEADIIIQKYQLKHIDSLGMVQRYEGEYEDKNIILIITGIGKIGASLATSYLLSNYGDLDLIINIGIAGNLSKKAKVGDVFIIKQCYQHDIYLPFDGDHLNYAKKPIILENKIKVKGDNFDVFEGICATGDQFIDNTATLDQIREKYQADVVEMEAFAILSVAREYDMLDRCIVIKAISDGANSDAVSDHMSHLDFAMDNSVEVLDKII